MNGLIIAPIFLFYTVVSFFVLYLVFALLKIDVSKLRNKLLIFFIVITFPFWDLMVQKVIKEVYLSSGTLKPKIYAYPERGKDEMIESFQIEMYLHISSLAQKNIDSIIKYISKNNIDVLKNEIKYFDVVFIVKKEKRIFRFYFEDGKVIHKELKKQQARFKKINKQINKYLFGLFSVGGEQIVDTKTNKVLAETFYVGFYDDNIFGKFRKEYLFLLTANGARLFYVKGIGKNILWNTLILEKNMKEN